MKDLTVALIAQGHTAHSFLDNGANLVGGVPSVEESEENYPNSILNWDNNPLVKEVFEFEMQSLKESDTVILLEPAGRSSLIEAGIAYGMGKKVVRVGRVEHPEMIAYCICEGYYASTDDFLKSIT